NSGRHLLRLLNDILDLSKIEAGKMELGFERFSLPALLRDVLTVISVLTIKKAITLEAPAIEEDLYVWGDKGKLTKIMYNLLHNAVKFTPPGGRIAIEVVDRHAGIEVSISDTGIGIDRKDQGRIFNAFEQADGALNRHYEGTGLGLALVKQLVEMHG